MSFFKLSYHLFFCGVCFILPFLVDATLCWCPKLFMCGSMTRKKIPFEKIRRGRRCVVILELFWVKEMLDAMLCMKNNPILSILVLVLTGIKIENFIYPL